MAQKGMKPVKLAPAPKLAGGGKALAATKFGDPAAVPSGGGDHRSWLTKLADEIVHTAEDAPSGIVGGYDRFGKWYQQQIGGAILKADPIQAFDDPKIGVQSHFGHSHPAALAAVIRQMSPHPIEDIHHPLSLQTALDAATVLSLGAAGGLRGAAGLAAVRGVETGSKLDKLEAGLGAVRQNPALTDRLLTVPSREGGSLVVKGQYPRAGRAILTTKATDKLLQGGARRASAAGEDATKIDKLLEGRLDKRVAKINRRTADVTRQHEKLAGLRVTAIAKKLNLDDGEQRALRIVAETVDHPTVLATGRKRLSDAERKAEKAQEGLDNLDPGASRKARKIAVNKVLSANAQVYGHEDRVGWIKDAEKYLTHDAEGHPVFNEAGAHLAPVLDFMDKAVGDREKTLVALRLMDEEGLKQARTNAARSAAGAVWQPSKAGSALAAAVRHENRLEKRVARLAKKYPHGYTKITRPRTEAEAVIRLAELEKGHYKAVDDASKAFFGPISQREVNARTADNKRAVRQMSGKGGYTGHKTPLRPTIKEERRRMAEIKLADMAEQSNHPILKAHLARVQEIEDLRNRITPDDPFGGAKPDYGTVEDWVYKAQHGAVERASAALSIARDERQRLEDRYGPLTEPGLVGAEDVAAGPNAVHVGSPRDNVRLPGSSGLGSFLRVSPGGTLGRTRAGSVKHAKGLARELGRESNKTTEIVATRHAEGMRLMTLAREVQKLAKLGTAKPTYKDDIWLWTDGILNSGRIDGSVKQFLQDPSAILTKNDDELRPFAKKLQDAVMGDPSLRWKGENIDPRTVEKYELLAQKGEGVFVRRSLLGDAAHSVPIGADSAVTKTFDMANNVLKTLLIYAKGSYIPVQAASNAAMILIHSGFAAPFHLAYAIALNKSLGHEYAGVIDAMMGQGALQQAAFRGSGRIAGGQRALVHQMGKLTDVAPRRAAWLHEAHRLGYSTGEEIKKLLTDPALSEDLNDVTLRARRAIIDYDDLTVREKQWIRRFIFVYPWVKGSTKYAYNFLQDHPVQASVLTRLGQEGAKINQQAFGDRPTYDENLVPFGQKAINLASFTPFSTPAELGRSIVNAATMSNKGTSGVSYLAPFAGTLSEILTHRDEQGYPAPSNLAKVLREQFLGGTPPGRLVQGSVGDRQGALADLARTVVGTERPSASFPDRGAENALLNWLLGGFHPRRFDRSGIERAAYFEGGQ